MLIALPSLLLALGAAQGAVAHSWIEQMRNIDAQGNYVGEYGYPRGFISKFQPGYNGETDMVYLLPPLPQQPPFINAENLLCHPNQRKQVQSDKYPRLQATPGGWLALRYAENGHVSNPSDLDGHVPGELDLARRKNGGSVFVFGTTEPKEDEKIFDVLQWTKDGQGGDKRGVLLTVNDYDDGRCYEMNPVTKPRQAAFPNFAQGQAVEGAPGNFPLMCETNVEVPKNAPSGQPYTLYWVWQWPKEPGIDPFFPKGKDEYYTTCMDIDIVDAVQQSGTLQFGLAQQDAQSAAVRDFRDRKALITDPIKGEVGPIFSDKPTATQGPSAPPQTTFATSIGAPSTNTSSPGFEIPTITKRPGGKPTEGPGEKPTETPADDDNVVRITVTERITVTASVATQTPEAQKRAEHIGRHGALKIRRGMSSND